MGIFNFLKSADINRGIQEYRSTESAVLLDVRDRQEYISGHIPGAINIPLSDIGSAKEIITDLASPVFTCCYSGRRSGMAIKALEKMGYSNVKNIGGIASYKGQMDR